MLALGRGGPERGSRGRAAARCDRRDGLAVESALETAPGQSRIECAEIDRNRVAWLRAAEGKNGLVFGRAGGEQRHHQDRARESGAEARGHSSWLRVATRVQFGSRERMSRAKVQMSVTCTVLFGSPSTTAPCASFTAMIWSLVKWMVMRASRLSSSARSISAESMRSSLFSQTSLA